MKVRTSNFASLMGLAVLVGCGSTPTVKVGEELSDSSAKVKVKLEGKGQLFVAQQLKAGAKNCESLKRLLTVKIRRDGEGLPFTVRTSCDFMRQAVVAHTEKDLPKGEYLVDVNRDWDRSKTFVENPVVHARYLDADFNSGSDFIPDGAQAIEPGQVLKGSVSYSAGNATDWIRLKGKNTTVNLTYLEGSDSAGVVAHVFDFPAGARAPRPVFALRHKQRVTLKLREDNLVVRVNAKDYMSRGDYQMVRADVAAGTGTKKASVPVIDAYPLSDSQSVVLLQKVGSLKVSDSVSVYGKNGAGKTTHVGDCEVTSVTESQASCRLEGNTTGFTTYTAELKTAS